MNEVTVFENPEFGTIRTMIMDNEPWFVGKDVAERLGYANPQKAVRAHIDSEDRRKTMIGENIRQIMIGKNIRRIRTDRNMTQIALSSKSGVAEPATAPIVQESKPEEIESTVADIPAENAEIEFLTNENGQMMLF